MRLVKQMNAILDVCYRGSRAWAACVTFESWPDSKPADILTIDCYVSAEYKAGYFFKRELPCLLAVLEAAGRVFEHIVIDGFVYLAPPLISGLGDKLASALDYHPAVIGVAKSPLKLADRFVALRRGISHRPLYVSSVNCPLRDAAEHIMSMHGSHRIPTLIRMADRAARAAAGAD